VIIDELRKINNKITSQKVNVEDKLFEKRHPRINKKGIKRAKSSSTGLVWNTSEMHLQNVTKIRTFVDDEMQEFTVEKNINKETNSMNSLDSNEPDVGFDYLVEMEKRSKLNLI
jgi:hypothetical protein